MEGGVYDREGHVKNGFGYYARRKKQLEFGKNQGEFLIGGWEKETMMCNNEAHTCDHFPSIILLTVL
jgi:hypothetical protein